MIFITLHSATPFFNSNLQNTFLAQIKSFFRDTSNFLQEG